MTTATANQADPAIRSGPLTGVGALVAFMLRRDRLRLPAWVLGITLSLWTFARALPGLYPDAASRQLRADLMQSPGAIAFGGPRIGVADYTFGAMLSNEMLGMTAALIGLISIFTVVRHGRADEETGRTELVRAQPVGRHAPLAAALTVTLLMDLALAVAVALSLGSLGLASVHWAGSWLYGAALGSVGLVFAAVAALTSQISEHARSASALAGLVLGIAYGLRAVGDVLDNGLSWLSPIGWAQRTYAFVDDRWWPLLLAAVVTAALIAVTVALAHRRDFGAGIRQPRPGPTTASPRLSTPLGLSVRLQRVALVAWTLSMVAFGLVYGSLLGQVQTAAGQTERVEAVLAGYAGSLIDAFLSLLVVLLAMTTSIFAVIATLRAQAEERAGHAEAVLAGAVSRSRWLRGHAAVAAVGGVVVLLGGSLGVGASGAVALHDGHVLLEVLSGAAVQVVPLLLVVAMTVALYGLAPRLTGLVWVVVGYGLFTSTFGGLLQLPGWMSRLSPFEMVPRLPGDAFTPWPVLVMLVVAAVLYTAGVRGLQARDLQSEG